MKKQMKLLFAAVIAATATFLAFAGSIVHDNGSAAALENGSAWQGGVAPTATDVAVFGSADASMTFSFGTALSWLGLEWAGVTGTPSEGATLTGSETLTVGASGIKVSTGSAAALTMDEPIVAQGDQTWALNGPHFAKMCFNGAISATGILTLGGSGSGCFDLNDDASIDGSGNVKVSGTTKTYLCFRGADSAVTAPLAVDSRKGNVMLVRDTDNQYEIGGVIACAKASGGFVNNGRLLIGGREDSDGGDAGFASRRQNLRVDAGSKVAMTTSDAERDSAMVQVEANSDVLVNGGSVEQAWFRIAGGKWRQAAGLTSVKYSAAIGRGAVAEGVNQELAVEGGTFSFYRAQVGLANSDLVPAHLVVSDGTLESTATAANGDFGGLDIGMRCLAGDARGDGAESSEILTGENASGRVDLQGGVLKTSRIGFGGHITGGMATAVYPDSNSSAAFMMTGGELRLGGIGIAPNDGWNGYKSQDFDHDCQYKVVFAGGKVTTCESGTKQGANVCLATPQMTYEIGSGYDYTVTAPMYGLGGLLKKGAGTMTFACGNDYTGATVVAEGALVAEPDILIGSTINLDAETLPAGTVSSWGFGGDHAFTTAVPRALPATVSDPTLGKMGAHPAVRFDGTAALGLTGMSSAAASVRGLTVGVVFSIDPDADCGNDSAWQGNVLFLGHVMHNSSSAQSKRGWGVAVGNDGYVRAGSSFVENNSRKFEPYTLVNDRVNVKDGRPHVVFYRWSDVTNHTVWVDGEVVTGSESAATKDWVQTFATRTELGVQDTAGSGTPKFLKGCIAKVQTFTTTAAGGATKSDAEIEAMTRTLVAYYGIASASAETVSRADYPAATTELVADSIDAAAGAAVSTWTPRKGNTTAYSVTTANAVMNSSTAPTLIDAGFNGHKAVRLNGTTDALAVGGAGAAYMKDAGSGNGTKKGFTVSMVVRFNTPGTGASSSSAFGCLPFFGPTVCSYGDSYLWSLALSANGRLRGGSVLSRTNSSLADDQTLIPGTAWMNDGRTHVIVMTMPDYGDTTQALTLTVDGYRAEKLPGWTGLTTLGYGKTYMILGGTNRYKGTASNYARLGLEVADIRFWPEIQLTADQVRGLSEDLAATYGAELDGYLVRGANGQRSSLVRVEEGATYGSDSDSGIVNLCAGQVLEGAGDVRGKLRMAAGSSVRLTKAAAPSFDSVTLGGGAKIVLAESGFKPMTVENGLYVGSDDKVVIDCSALPVSGEKVTVAQCGKPGTFASGNFVFEGAPAGQVKAYVSDDGKKLMVKKGNFGVIIVVR